MARERVAFRFEVIDHGIEHSQYFRGCGTAGTEYEEVATGIGDSAQEAFEDALEILAQMGWDVSAVTMPDNMGTDTVQSLRDEELTASEANQCSECGLYGDDCECADGPHTVEAGWGDDERWYHVSVRVRSKTTEEIAYRTVREQACLALRMPTEVEDGILADAMEDSPAFSETAILTIRDGI